MTTVCPHQAEVRETQFSGAKSYLRSSKGKEKRCFVPPPEADKREGCHVT